MGDTRVASERFGQGGQGKERIRGQERAPLRSLTQERASGLVHTRGQVGALHVSSKVRSQIKGPVTGLLSRKRAAQPECRLDAQLGARLRIPARTPGGWNYTQISFLLPS